MRDSTYYSLRDEVAHIPASRGAEWCPRLYWSAPTQFNPDAPTAGAPVPAVVNHGRWIVMCPDCPGAQLASMGDARFMCTYCGNVANGGAWRPVLVPAQRAQIETVVESRPDLKTQNWAGEALADLVAENVDLGLPDPKKGK